MSEEIETRRRQSAPEVAARRVERQLMAPFRRRIGVLQTRTAFNAARALSAKSQDEQMLAAEYQRIRDEVASTLDEIATLVPGRGLGAAEDCRKALQVLHGRLP